MILKTKQRFRKLEMATKIDDQTANPTREIMIDASLNQKENAL